MRRPLVTLILLALTQITGWGTISTMPVIAGAVAAEFETTLSMVFLSTSALFIAMALSAPFAGRALHRFGPRDSMAAGAGLIGLGLCLLSLAPNLPVFLGIWAVIGLAGSLFLTTAAYAYIAEHAEGRARSLIGTLMLATGLAGSLFWPLTAYLDHLSGWRGAVLTYGVVMALLICPLLRFGLTETKSADNSPVHPKTARHGAVFALLVTAIALNSFVTFGIESVGIELLQAMGASPAAAIAIASALGVFKVGGRLIDLLGGQRWDGLSTALVSGAMIPLGLAALWLGGAVWLAVGIYLVLFGIGSGAFAVARATMPLVFFSRADYTAAMSFIALPMNLINALAPPLLAVLLTGIGAQAVFAILGGLSLAALCALVQLKRLQS